MSQALPDTNTAVSWCVTARNILKRSVSQAILTRSIYEVDLKAITRSAVDELGKLTSRGLNKTKDDLDEKVQTVGRDIHAIDEDTTKSDTEKHDEVKVLAEDLERYVGVVGTIISKYDNYARLLESAKSHVRSLKSHGAVEAEHEDYRSIVNECATCVLDNTKELDELGTDLDDYIRRLDKRTIDGKAKAQERALNTERSNAISDAEHRAVYEDKVRRIEEAIQELESLPATEEARGKLQRLISGSLTEAKPGNYKRAYDSLQGLSSALEEGKRAASRFSQSPGGQDVKEALDGLKEAVREYRDLCGIAHAEEVKTAHDEYLQILRELSVATPDVDKAKNDAGQVVTRLRRLKEAAERDKTACEDFGELVDRIRELEAIAEYHIAGEVRDEYASAKSLYGLQNYSLAKDKYGEVRTRVNRELDRLRPLKSAWDTKENEVKEAIADTEGIRENWSHVFKEFIEVRGAILSEWTQIAGKVNIAKERNWSVATTAAEGIRVKLTDPAKPLGVLKEKFTLLEEKLKEAQLASRNLPNPVTAKLNSLVEQGADVTEYSNTKSEILEKFELAKANSFTSVAGDDPESFLTRAISTFTGEIEDLKGTLDRLLVQASKEEASERVEFDALVTSAAEKKKEASLENLLKEIDKKIKYVQEERQDASTLLSKKNEIVRKRGEDPPEIDIDEAISQAQQLEREATTACASADSAREREARAAADKVEACKRALKTLTSAHKKHKPFLETKGESIQSLDATLKSSSSVAMKVASNQLDELKTELEATGGSSLKSNLEGVDGLLTTLADSSHLKKPDIKKFRATRQKTLEKRLEKSVKPTTYGEEPGESLTPPSELKTFESEVSKLSEEAEQFKTVQDRADRLATELENRLKEDKLKAILGQNPKTLKAIKAQIKAAKTPNPNNMYQGEMSLKAVQIQLRKFEEEATGAGKDAQPGDTLLNHEAQIAKSELDQQVKEKSFQSNLSLFEKNELRSAETQKSHVGRYYDELRWSDLQSYYKQAKKFGKKHDLDRAADFLERAKDAAIDFAFSPLGPVHAARGQLATIEKRWKVVLSRFSKEIIELRRQLQEAGETDPTIDASKLKFALKSLDQCGRLFDPNAFSTAVTEIAREDIELKDLRRHKETALRTVRAYQRSARKDPVLAEIANPSGNPFQAARVDRVLDVLTDFELNLKRA